MNPKGTTRASTPRGPGPSTATTPRHPLHGRGPSRASSVNPPRFEATNPIGAWAQVHTADELTDLLARIVHPILVAFEGRQCAHCRAQRAVLSLAWHQLAWQVTILRVDGRRLPHVAEQFRINGYPTLLVFSRGEVIDRLPGRRDARNLIHRLSRLNQPEGWDRAGGAPTPLRPYGATRDASAVPR